MAYDRRKSARESRRSRSTVLTSYDAYSADLQQLSSNIEADRLWQEPGGAHARRTVRLNRAAFVSLLLGIVALGYFVCTNLGKLS